MAITVKKIAKLLNLSEAAVSMALNNKPGVSTATRNRIIHTAKEYGYDFSRIQEMDIYSQNSNGTIQFILYKKHGAIVTDTPFFSELSEGIDSGCKQHHYYLNIYYIYDGEDITAYLNELENAGCKGIILLGTELQGDNYLPFEKTSIPVVLLDTYFENCNLNCILINNIQGAYLATTNLIRKYKCQPGYLKSSYAINNFNERADGFYKALRENGMSTSKSIVHSLSPSMDGAYADMIDLLNHNEDISRCYFADNDLIACGAMKAFQEKGYRIPEDVAIIGFDNMPLSNYMNPPLTTIHVPKRDMGEIAVNRLVTLIESAKNIPMKIEISTSLVTRKST